MPSPFPGMDPYLESPDFWSDVHGSLIYTMRAALTGSLPAGFTADMDQHVWVQEDADEDGRGELLGRTDVSVTGEHVGTATAVAEPVPTTRVRLPGDRRRTRRYIRIVDRRGGRVVTAIELLSPSNKDSGPDRDAYLSKRREYLGGPVNLVEIDLLRSGERMPLGRPRPPVADYYCVVRRGSADLDAGVWAFGVREPFPPLPIPLTPGMASVVLDLRPCFDRAYDDGGYARKIVYSRPPDPPLRPADAAWAAELLSRTR